MQRYSRQIILPNFGIEAQNQLSKSKILVVGAGGLGVPVLQYLAAAGIGTLGIADGDVLEISNLQRQVLYQENDIGRNKAELAKEKLKHFNSGIEMHVYDFFINERTVFQIIEEYDIVVDCTDDFAIRYLLNDVCYLMKKPLVFAAIYQFEAQLSVFHYNENPFNLRDIFPEIPNKNSVPNCNEAGVLGTLAGIAGCLQANEVIKIITKIGEVNAGKLLLFNSLRNETTQISITKNNEAFSPKTKNEILEKNYGFFCETKNEISNLDELKLILEKQNSVLIDVREQEEEPKIDVFPVLEIPLADLKNNFFKFETYEHLIFICKSGIRSKKALIETEKYYPNKKKYHCKNGLALFKNEK